MGTSLATPERPGCSDSGSPINAATQRLADRRRHHKRRCATRQQPYYGGADARNPLRHIRISHRPDYTRMMRYRIRTDFQRPPAELIAAVAATHVGVTGVYAGPRQVADAAIKPLRTDWRICGPALTVRPEYADDLLMGEIAARFAQPGDVIVVDAAARTDVACWGMGMSMAAHQAGCAGVVLDGACINGALLVRENPQLPIFARGLTALAGGADKPGWLNGPIICGGVICPCGGHRIGRLRRRRDSAGGACGRDYYAFCGVSGTSRR